MTSFSGRVIGIITLKKTVLKEVIESDDATAQAWMLFIISLTVGAFFQGVAAYLNSKSVIYAIFLRNVNGVNLTIDVVIVYLVFNFLVLMMLSFMLFLTGGSYGGYLSVKECFRLVAFASFILLVPPAILAPFSAIYYSSSLTIMNMLTVAFVAWFLMIVVLGYSYSSNLSVELTIIAFIPAVGLAMIIAIIVAIVLSFILLTILT